MRANMLRWSTRNAHAVAFALALSRMEQLSHSNGYCYGTQVKSCAEAGGDMAGMYSLGVKRYCSSSVSSRQLYTQSVPSRDLSTMQSLEKLLDVSGNMRPYRTAFAMAKSPAIPFFPIVLKDLTFFVEGNRTYLEDNSAEASSGSLSSLNEARRMLPNDLSLVNFAKFRTVARFVTDMLELTSENYSFAGLLETAPFFNLTAGFGPEATDMATSKCIAPLDILAHTIERRIQIVPTSPTYA